MRPKNTLKDACNAVDCDDANRNQFRKEKITGLGDARSANHGARQSLRADVAGYDVCLTAKIDRSNEGGTNVDSRRVRFSSVEDQLLW